MATSAAASDGFPGPQVQSSPAGAPAAAAPGPKTPAAVTRATKTGASANTKERGEGKGGPKCVYLHVIGPAPTEETVRKHSVHHTPVFALYIVLFVGAQLSFCGQLRQDRTSGGLDLGHDSSLWPNLFLAGVVRTREEQRKRGLGMIGGSRKASSIFVHGS